MPNNYIAYYFLQFIPETFLTILFGYAFAHKRIDARFFVSGFALSVVSAALVFGLTVNQIITQQIATILMFVSSALLLILYSKIDVLKAIISNILLLIIFIVVELANYVLLVSAFGVDEQFLNDLIRTFTIQKWVYGLPNLLLKLVVIPLFYIIMIRTGKKKDASVE